jgi:hypothetical protein
LPQLLQETFTNPKALKYRVNIFLVKLRSFTKSEKGSGGSVGFLATPPAQTPLPAALPLFATASAWWVYLAGARSGRLRLETHVRDESPIARCFCGSQSGNRKTALRRPLRNPIGCSIRRLRQQRSSSASCAKQTIPLRQDRWRRVGERRGEA